MGQGSEAGEHGGRIRAIPPVGTQPQNRLAPSPRGKWSSGLIFSTLKRSNEFDSQNDLLTQPAERVFEGRSKPVARQWDIFLSSASYLFLSTPGQLIINEIFVRCCFHACCALSLFPGDREVGGLHPTPTAAAFAGEPAPPGRPRSNPTCWLSKALEQADSFLKGSGESQSASSLTYKYVLTAECLGQHGATIN